MGYNDLTCDLGEKGETRSGISIHVNYINVIVKLHAFRNKTKV